MGLSLPANGASTTFAGASGTFTVSNQGGTITITSVTTS
jgi:hypothetical protein